MKLGAATTASPVLMERNGNGNGKKQELNNIKVMLHCEFGVIRVGGNLRYT